MNDLIFFFENDCYDYDNYYELKGALNNHTNHNNHSQKTKSYLPVIH